MADHYASIYGTEKDKINCPFYFKIGACRHGERCTRKHVKPTFAQTIIMPNLYKNPSHDLHCRMSSREIEEKFDLFYEDLFVELAKYGIIEELHICDNICDHLAGNIYVRFRYEEGAQKAADELNNRFYDGRPIWAELSPVIDFREACCRKMEAGECNRAGLCNFMHLKSPASRIKRDLYEAQRKSMKIFHSDRRDSRSRSRERSPAKSRSRSRDGKRSREDKIV